MNRALGVDIDIITPSEVSEIVPQVCTDGVAVGAYEPNSGYADPMATTYAFAGAGDQPRSGDSDRVRGYRHQDRGRACRRRGDAGWADRDGRCVAATGPWANQLAAPLGETLPISPLRVQTIHLRRPPSLESLRTIIIDRTTGTYLRVNSGFNTLVGGEAFEDLNEVVNPDAFGLNADHDTITRFWDRAKVRVPEFRAATPMGGYGSLYDMTPGWQSGPGRFKGGRGTVLGGGLQWTRIQAVPGSGPDGGGTGVARREQRPPDSPIPRESFYRGRPSGRRASL